jgi:hypothetical protein
VSFLEPDMNYTDKPSHLLTRKGMMIRLVCSRAVVDEKVLPAVVLTSSPATHTVLEKYFDDVHKYSYVTGTGCEKWHWV